MKLWNTIKNNKFFMDYFQIKKQLKIAMDGLLRPFSGDTRSQSLHVYPRFPYNTYVLYDLAYNSDTVTGIHNALRRELFRNGYDLVEAEKTDEQITDSEQDTEPVGATKEEILKILENINENSQGVLDVLFELEDDFSIMDDGFLLFIFDYFFDVQGKIVSRKFSQAMRTDPRFMGLIMNIYDRPGYDDDNVPQTVCPIHRDSLLADKNICPQCGKECRKAFFFTDYGSQKMYYFKEEVVFRSKYRPSKRRGYSPILTCWQKIRTLLFQDKYIMEMYDGQRPPKAGLFFKTSNQDGLKKGWDTALQRTQENPHLPIIMGIPDSTNGQGFVEFIDFMKSLNEMQYTEARNEMRRQIGAVYGVEPIFQGDQSTSGGLNNEGLQITVTNRAVQYGQGIYNKYYLTALLNAMGVGGWVLTLNPSEEQDEMAKLQRQNQSLANGELATKLGLEAEFDDDTGEVIIKPGILEAPTTNEGFPNGFSSNPEPPLPPEMEGAPSLVAESIKKRRPAFTKMADAIKSEIELFSKAYKRKPSEKELKGLIKKIKNTLNSELKETTRKFFEKTYLQGMDKVGRELGVNITFGAIDKNAIQALATQKILFDAYDGITKTLTDKINDILIQAYKTESGLNLTQITDKLQEAVRIRDSRAETIARTEMSKVSSAARRNSYKKEDPDDEFRYKHIGPNDNRTTVMSKEVKESTKNGVSWDNYVATITRVSQKHNPKWVVNSQYPITHPNTRHSFVRIV